MTITIHQDILDYASLSEEAQLVLGFIPGGLHWFEQTSKASSANYVFNSQAEFLSAVLDGLHNTSLLYITPISLLVDPEKLLMLGTDQLVLINDAIRSERFEDAKLRAFENGLLNNIYLKDCSTKFLSKCGLTGNGLFQVMSLSDRIKVTQLADDPQVLNFSPKSSFKDAAGYAVSMAQTPSEFCQLFRFYLTVVNQLRINSSTSDIRLIRVQEIQRALSPFANEMLICPQISGSTGEEEINQAIITWIDYGNEFGFESLPAALLQLAQNIPLYDLFDELLASEVERFQRMIQEFMRHNPVMTPWLSQDGKHLIYPVDSTNPTVRFSLNQQGCLALEEFRYQRLLTSNE